MSKSPAFEQSLLAFKQKLTHNLLFGFLIVCVFALPLSLLRWFTIGFQYVFIQHIIITLVVIVCYFWNNSKNFKSYLFIITVLLTSMIISGTLSFGLQTGASAFSAFCTVIVALGWGARAAIIYAIISTILFMGVGYLFTQGHIQYALPPNDYAKTSSAWLFVATGTSILSVFTLISAKHCYQHFGSLVDEIEQQKQAIETLANVDSMTGYCCNRLSMPHLKQALNVATREGNKVAVVFIDLDNFKQINDKYGHQVGDAVLTKVTSKMRAVLRDIDIPCRVGGDEFLFILPGIHTTDELTAILKRIEDVWLEPIIIDDTKLSVSGSIGVALYPDDGLTAEELRTKSDFAMYRAKKSSQNAG